MDKLTVEDLGDKLRITILHKNGCFISNDIDKELLKLDKVSFDLYGFMSSQV